MKRKQRLFLKNGSKRGPGWTSANGWTSWSWNESESWS
jgi:hypothetical protein